MKPRKMKVAELFAGVGGFRIGLEKNKNYKVVWSNQWEPSTKTQHASMVYEARFGDDNHSNVDIAQVLISEIPDHDILLGGFPCQPFSIAGVSKKNNWGVTLKGRAFRSNLFFVPQKRISTAIPNAKLAA